MSFLPVHPHTSFVQIVQKQLVLVMYGPIHHSSHLGNVDLISPVNHQVDMNFLVNQSELLIEVLHASSINQFAKGKFGPKHGKVNKRYTLSV